MVMVGGRFIAAAAQEKGEHLPKVQPWFHTTSNRSLGGEGASMAELNPKTSS